MKTMKVYEVHSYGGEWEDAYDYVEGRFDTRLAAEQLMNELKKDNEDFNRRADRCEQCTFGCGNNEPCEDYELDGSGGCENWTYHQIYDDMFRIDEVEVTLSCS